MRLIFIYGFPATGKLTVAQALSQRCGYQLFHNHLAVDLLLSTFPFGTPPFVELREQIWLSVFDHAFRVQLQGLIFTFNPEPTVRASFIQNALNIAAVNNASIDFVELICPLPELKRRIDSPSRHHFHKLTSLSLFERLHAAGDFDTSHMPRPRLTIDTSLGSPHHSAALISDALNLPLSLQPHTPAR